MTIIIFNTCIIFINGKFAHWSILIFVDDILDVSFLNLSMNAHLLIESFAVIDLSLNVLDYCLCFVFFLSEDIRKIHQIVEFASL
jgi:hypothetical protein